MEEMLYLALHDGIAAVSLEGELLCRANMDGVLTLCAGEESVFCADRNGAIWRFERENLMPQMLGCGGPGICDMCLSRDGKRLYTLLGEGDSVLMSDAKSCRPLALNRCGCNPKSLVCCGDSLAAAGGENCRVHLYCAKTLDCISEIRMPGPVYSAALLDGVVYALCLAQDMHTLLVAVRGGRMSMLRLCGIPGSLCVMKKHVFAATYGWQYVFSREGLRLVEKHPAPGCADRLLVCCGRLIAHDPLNECVFMAQNGGAWKRLCSDAVDVSFG